MIKSFSLFFLYKDLICSLFNMKEHAHISITIGFSLLLTAIYDLFFPIGLLFYFMGFFFAFLGKLNDWLDFTLYKEHRRHFLSHSPLSPLLILISILIGAFFSIVRNYFGIFIGLISYLIFILHFLMDSLNYSGVPILPGKKIRIATIKYDNFRFNILFLILGISMIFLSLIINLLF